MPKGFRTGDPYTATESLRKLKAQFPAAWLWDATTRGCLGRKNIPMPQREIQQGWYKKEGENVFGEHDMG